MRWFDFPDWLQVSPRYRERYGRTLWGLPDRILTVLTTPEFRNVAATKWDIATDIHNLLGTALDEARTVEALLDDELERRQ